jgi:hypothetical protein
LGLTNQYIHWHNEVHKMNLDYPTSAIYVIPVSSPGCILSKKKSAL